MRGNDLTYAIIGAAMEVHRRLGPWHPERVYQRALFSVLTGQGLTVLSQPRVTLTWDGTVLAVYRPDLVVRREGETVLVEIKAEPSITEAHLKQVRAYLAAWRGPARGLVLNFGQPRLAWKQVRKPRSALPRAPSFHSQEEEEEEG